jgi:hypothetical protein
MTKKEVLEALVGERIEDRRFNEGFRAGVYDILREQGRRTYPGGSTDWHKGYEAGYGWASAFLAE